MPPALLYCLLAFVFIDRARTSPDEPQLTFEDLYLYGKYDYTDGNWPSCVAFMRRAMEDFQ
ncbi:unnamed protein product [Strongylus vulgaris]|uniref:Uncharacterized protein n=1 Tax=Strongylus vulgaris TaxID=40348 RepID=A0A3P7JRP1_STRVU|nr:unnamed protein product [Strongylus vulgaris]